MTNNSPDDRREVLSNGQDEIYSDWARSSRYLTVKTIQSAKRAEPPTSPQPPKKRITQADKDALLTAALILLVIAGAAFFAGLL